MKKTVFISSSALIAAMYVALTLVSNAFGLANGAVQLRLSEALTVLPFFTPAAIPGLFIGCVVSNIITGCAIWDIVFGSIATLLAAVATRLLRKYRWLAPLPPVFFNALIIPFVLRYTYGAPGSLPYLVFTVSMGEILSAYVLGMILLFSLNKYSKQIFRMN